MKNWIELNRQGIPQFMNLDHISGVLNVSGFATLVFADGMVQFDESYDEVVLMIHHAGEDEISIQHTERVGNVEVRETIYQQSNDVPVRVERADCSNALRMQGNVAVPRTCKACGLGPCKYGRATLT